MMPTDDAGPGLVRRHRTRPVGIPIFSPAFQAVVPEDLLAPIEAKGGNGQCSMLGPPQGGAKDQLLGLRAEGRLASGVGVVDNALLARGLLDDTSGGSIEWASLSRPQAPGEWQGAKPGLGISHRLAKQEVIVQAWLEGSRNL